MAKSAPLDSVSPHSVGSAPVDQGDAYAHGALRSDTDSNETTINGLGAYLDRSRMVAVLEHNDAVARMYLAAKIALFLWPLFALTDLLIALVLEPGPITPYVILRLLGWGTAWTAFITLRNARHVSRAVLSALDFLMFTGAGLLIASMCIFYQGIDSPYAHGVITAMIVRSVCMSDRWRNGAMHYGSIAASYPIMMIVGALFSARMAQQFSEPAAVGVFALNLFFILVAAGTLTVAGHVLWGVRRQAYAAKNLGRYKLKERIGHGGMSEVWVAFHEGLQTDVAVKILKSEHGRSREAVGRFEREVRALTRLSHPNTIHVIDHGVTEEGIWYYAMELLEGTDLMHLVDDAGPLSPARAIHLAMQACGSLVEAHQQGFVHRDIKPENLFVTWRGGLGDYLKILDFGIAKVSEDLEKTHLTRTGIMQGTPRYMSPEAIMGHEVDARSDIYSMGCVMYYMLSARPPFDAGTVPGLLMQHLHSNPPTFREVVKREIPADLEMVVMRCLEKEPQDRFQSIKSVENALGKCVDAGSWAPAPSPPRPKTPRLTRLSHPDN